MLLPKSLQQEAISLAHEGSHPGLDAIKHRLRAHFWFPGMDNAIKLQVENCHKCQITTATPIKAPLTSTPILEKPWQNISIDLFGPPPRPKTHTCSRLQPQSISRCKNCSLNRGPICPPSIGRNIQELWQH